MAEDVTISIGDLLLDPENPRFPPGPDAQIELRQAILDDQGSKIAELAADIVRNGLSPMDRMMILRPDPHKTEVIALEGNRRTAALQILNNPDLLTDLHLPDPLRNKLVDLAETFDATKVEPIRAVLMPDRESARRWIEIRHIGENDGRGIVGWTGVQTARFRGDKMLKILEFVKLKGELEPVEKTAIEANFPITTLDRIISNPTVRQKIGVQIVDGEFYFSYPWEEEIKILKRIVLDLALKKINVTAVKNKEQQISYIDGLPTAVLPAGPKLTAPLPLTSVLTATPPPPPPPAPPPPPGPLERKTIIPRGFSLSIPNQKALQIFCELRSLNIEKYPVAGAVILRSFVEATVDVYCTANSISTTKPGGKSMTLVEKVEAVIAHLGGKMTKQEAKAARTTLTNKSGVISVNRLNDYVHNPAMFPARSDLIAGWSGVEAFFKACWK